MRAVALRSRQLRSGYRPTTAATVVSERDVAMPDGY